MTSSGSSIYSVNARTRGLTRSNGSLIPSMLADLVVLDRDPYETPFAEQDQIEVVTTMVAGEWVHGGEFTSH